jgi:hypothetical protein
MRICVLCVALIVLALPDPASAQYVAKLQRLRGEIGVRLRNSDWAPGQEIFLAQEWVHLKFRGSVVDDQFIQFGIGVRPIFQQSRIREVTPAQGSNFRNLGLDLDLRFLPSRPLSAGVQAYINRQDNNRFGINAADIHGRTSRINAEVKYDNVLMPLALRYNRHSAKRDFVNGTDRTSIPHAYESFRLGGANRKTTFQLERFRESAPTESTRRLLLFRNRQQWGKGSRFNTNLSYQDRTSVGRPRYSTFGWGGRLHLQHLGWIWSDWMYQQQEGRTNGSVTGRRFAAGSVGASVLRRTTTEIRTELERFAGTELDERRFRIEGRARTVLDLPSQATLGASASLGYEHYELARPANGWVDVIDESHGIDASGRFFLDKPEVDPTSVFIQAQDGLTLVEGADYVLEEAGGFLEVVVLPGGRVAEGDQVLVSYRYRPMEIGSTPSLVASLNADLKIKAFRIYYRRWLQDPAGEAFDDGQRVGRLRYLDNQTAGLSLTWALARTSFLIRAEHRYRVDDGYRVRSSRAGGRVTLRPGRRLWLSAGGDYSYTTSTSGKVSVLSGNGSLRWQPHSEVHFEGALQAWRSLKQDQLEKNLLGTDLRFSWTPGRLRFTVAYAYRDWDDLFLDTNWLSARRLNRFSLELARRF